MQDQLIDVKHIEASEGAFAALLADASMVSWGDAEFGGDSSGVARAEEGLGWGV